MLLAGCGDFFTKDGGGGGGGGSVGSYTYVGTQSGVLASYSVSTTGALASLSGSPFQLSTASINSLAITPGNTFLYAAVAGVGVYGLAINSSNGVTTLLNNGSALTQDVAPVALTVDPSGTHLLVAGLANGAAAVGEYAVNSDGTLSEVNGSPVSITFPSGTDTTNLAVQNIAVAPNSSYVFVTLGQLGIVPLPFNTSGSLSANTQVFGPKATSGVANQDIGLAVNPTSSALFIGETNVGVRVFTIGSNSALTEISGSPFAAGGQPRSITFDGTGDYLYVANATNNTISGYTVLASGSLTPLSGSPFSSVGAQPNALALDQSKKFLLSANLGGSPDLQLFSFDATTAGKLDPGASATNASTATSIASTH
ncbi:MAG TPA: beta-propeller fold lactonase family protein [Acidobacteriaceae bacterium]